jgi:hypothetical protein
MERHEAGDLVYCAWEAASFPKEQFERHAEYGMVHEHPPGDTPKHTTSGQILPTEEGAEQYWAIPSESVGRSD